MYTINDIVQSIRLNHSNLLYEKDKTMTRLMKEELHENMDTSLVVSTIANELITLDVMGTELGAFMRLVFNDVCKYPRHALLNKENIKECLNGLDNSPVLKEYITAIVYSLTLTIPALYKNTIDKFLERYILASEIKLPDDRDTISVKIDKTEEYNPISVLYAYILYHFHDILKELDRIESNDESQHRSLLTTLISNK